MTSSAEPSARSAKSSIRACLRHVGGGELMQGDCVGKHSFPSHHHDDYTIGLVTRGRESITSRGATHRLAQGALYFSNPAEAHDGRAADETGWSFFSLYLSPALVARLSETDEPLFPHFMLAPGKAAAHAAGAFATLSSSRCSLEIDTAIASLLDRALSPYDSDPIEVRRAGGGKLERVREYLEAHYAEDVPLGDLAQLVGMHPRHLIAAFKGFTGITPHAYLTTRRVNAAYESIRGGAAIAHAAASCGFYDQSHLNRHFKRMIGVTPDAVARAHKG